MSRSSIAIEQLRLLPEDDRIELLAARREDQWFDRTSARTTAVHLADAMLGFANAEGGLIAVGLHRGEIEGVRRSGGRINDWRQAALDFTVPPVRHRVEQLACVNQQGEQDEILVVEVEASEHVHTNVKGDTYLRVGDENRRLGPLEAQELRYDKGDSIFDGGAVVDLAPSDLDGALLGRYLERIGAESQRETALRARGLVTAKGEALHPTVAGALVLGRQPQQTLPHAILRILQYRGSSREAGTRANVVSDRRMEGPLPDQIDEARRTVRSLLPQAIRLERAGTFEGSTAIPEPVWLEAIVNAVTHRSYSIGGDHTRVEVFDDRMEVESPGRLPGLVRLENIRSTRFARNPRVARAMNDLGYSRELGEGVNRMFEEMSRAGLPDPIYSQGPASVRVVLLVDPLVGRILDRLPPGSERLAEFLSRTGRVTTSQAVDLLAVSRPTALRYLHELVAHELVEHVGTSLKDPRGFWRLRRGERRSGGR